MKLLLESMREAAYLGFISGSEMGKLQGMSDYDTEFAVKDFKIVGDILSLSGVETIVFDSAQLLELADARLPDGIEYRLPFQVTILQFTKPIPENRFFLDEGNHEFSDTLDALILYQGVYEESDIRHNQVVAWFGSTAINRTYFQNEGDLIFAEGVTPDEVRVTNKRTVMGLARSAIAYINSTGMRLRHQVPDAKVNRHRVAKGKRPLPNYYTVEIEPGYAERSVHTGTGTPHGHRYTVRGHWRHIAGKTTWVRPHFRGLVHEHFIPSVRHVKHEKENA